MKKTVSILLIIATLILTFISCGHMHQFGEWETVKAATCDDSGERKRTCSCGEIETEPIEKTGHNYVNEVCTNCGKSTNPESEKKYNEALSLITKGKYEEAKEIFESLGEYGDSQKMLGRFYSLPTMVIAEEDGENGTITFSFGSNNLPIKISRFVSGTYDGGYDFFYDENGNLIQEIETYHDGTKDITDYTYDANGNLAKRVYTDSNGDKSVRDYTYDANGKLIKRVYTDSDGDKEVCDYTYDAKGNLIKEVYTNSYGNKSISDYTYDAKGNLIKEVYTYSDGNKSIYDYTYDVNGNLIKDVYTSFDGNKSIYDYTYDVNGNLIKEVYTYSDGDKSIYDYTYDVNGNLIKEVYTYYDGDKEVCDYTYDAKGNLLKIIIATTYGSSGEMRFNLVYIPFDVSGLTAELLEKLSSGVIY